MAQWQMQLDFRAAKESYHDGAISLDELAARVVETIKAKLPRAKEINVDLGQQLEDDVLILFEEIAEDDEHSFDENDFDNALEALYDWADTPLDNHFGGKKMCWIVP